MSKFSRKNDANKNSTNRNVIHSTGAFKKVFLGTYTEGERTGQKCVSKEFKTGCVYENAYFANEMKVVEKSLDIITNYNNASLIDRVITLNTPEIWSYVDKSYGLFLCEPFIENFHKFNSNTGWISPEASAWNDVLQSLSHYSYHSTDGGILLCDLQGGIYADGVILTDPVIMSKEAGQYGPTDLGPNGITTFFTNHQCGKYCKRDWTRPANKGIYFKVQEGSTMAHVPTRASRPKMTIMGAIGE